MADALINKRSLLLHCDGTDGATSFTDSSPRPKTVAAFGAVVTSTAAPKFGSAAASFPGATSSDYISITDHADFDFGSGDFGIEVQAAIGTVAGGGCGLIGRWGIGPSTSADWLVYVSAARGLSLFIDGNERIATAGGVLPNDGAYRAILVSRDANTLRLFVDGALLASATYSGAVPNSGTRNVRIGRWDATDTYLNGKVDEIRITKGDPVHTAAYTPDAVAFEGYVYTQPNFKFGFERLQRVAGRAAPTFPPRLNRTFDLQRLSAYSGTAGQLMVGPGYVAGTLKVLTAPAARRVRLYDLESGVLLRSTVSAPDGTYRFNNLALGRKYFVVGLDDNSASPRRKADVADFFEAVQ